jgi:hypothetical protein
LPRSQWHELPPAVRAGVESHTGPILRATLVEAGSISDFAAVLETRDGRYFCKGAVAGNPMGWMHRNEARINPYLPAHMPRLHWQIEADGWLILGFEYVEGRHPNLSPDSPDLPAVAAFAVGVAALSHDRHQQRLSATHLGPLAEAAARWSHYRSGEKPRAGTPRA